MSPEGRYRPPSWRGSGQSRRAIRVDDPLCSLYTIQQTFETSRATRPKRLLGAGQPEYDRSQRPAPIAALEPLRIRLLPTQLAICGWVFGSLQTRWIPTELSSSVRCSWACLAPQIQFAAAPGHGTHTEANRVGELLLGHEPVDRGSTQARHLHDGWHAQKHGRQLIVRVNRCGGGVLQGILPVEVCWQL
jgi:hypothetical protein